MRLVRLFLPFPAPSTRLALTSLPSSPRPEQLRRGYRSLSTRLAPYGSRYRRPPAQYEPEQYIPKQGRPAQSQQGRGEEPKPYTPPPSPSPSPTSPTGGLLPGHAPSPRRPSPIDSEPTSAKSWSSRKSIKSVKRALKATARLVGLKSPAEKRAAKRAAEEEQARRHMRVRADLEAGTRLTEDDLRLVAAADNVRLNPRPTRSNRHMGDEDTFAEDIVARLAGPDLEGHYVFLDRWGRLVKDDELLGKGKGLLSSVGRKVVSDTDSCYSLELVSKAERYAKQLCRIVPLWPFSSHLHPLLLVHFNRSTCFRFVLSPLSPSAFSVTFIVIVRHHSTVERAR
ncbi:hypothetical protein F5Y17DRAFT_442507 [Xylariaceae sp. FL0594]|nr:hypothetical protein F5Y17DRAFT_442507 [Xylariaceae sp. FL0594]